MFRRITTRSTVPLCSKSIHRSIFSEIQSDVHPQVYNHPSSNKKTIDYEKPSLIL